MHKQEHNKNFRLIIVAIVLVVILAILGIVKLTSSGTKSHQTIVSDNKSKSSQVASKAELVPLPTAPLQCSGMASLVDLTTDYVVSGMNCYSDSNPNANPAPLSCDGSIFHQVLSFNCYRPYSYSYSTQLVCNGSSAAPTSDISFSYNCALPDLNANTIYACNGTIANYNPSSVSLPISVSCGP